MACAASPIRANLSLLIHGKHFTVIRDEVGLLKKSFTSAGIKGNTSGNVSLKKFTTFSSVVKDAKDVSPSNGKNKVHVKLPSQFGVAIIMKSLRGQTCSAFFERAKPPFVAGGILNSLYPQSI